jgi:hypothetical protein
MLHSEGRKNSKTKQESKLFNVGSDDRRLYFDDTDSNVLANAASSLLHALPRVRHRRSCISAISASGLLPLMVRWFQHF